MKLAVLILSLFFISCSQKADVEDKLLSQDTLKQVSSQKTDTTASTEIIEVFVDSTNIGKKGQCKIELIKHRVFDRTYVIVKFYTKGPAFWYIQNEYLYECTPMYEFEPNISDFNNDKFNDITFVSAQAARMANDVRRLFIYDDDEKSLVSIVNSEDFPNMLYNEELDCIDAFLVYGGSSTVFARIKGDSLIEFAGVESWSDKVTVYKIDKRGNKKTLRSDPISDLSEIFTRYSNYKPLKVWTHENK